MLLPTGFKLAQPVWPAGRSREVNLTVGFRAVFSLQEITSGILRITGASLYRFYVNGQFAGHGPARGPHGHVRVDEWDIAKLLHPGENVLAIDICGYNINTYYIVNEPSFLQAEIEANAVIVAATGSADTSRSFETFLLDERLQKVQRYSFQRAFIEYYRLKPTYGSWRSPGIGSAGSVQLERISDRSLLPRRVSYATFAQVEPIAIVASGSFITGHIPAQYWEDRSLVQVGATISGFPEQELEVTASREVDELLTTGRDDKHLLYSGDQAVALAQGNFHILDLGINRTGFIGGTFVCEAPTKFYILFDEILTDHDVDYKRMSCANIIGYELQPGEYQLESFEPYTARYWKFAVISGEIRYRSLYLRELTNPDTGLASFDSDRQDLNAIFTAAVETFNQNATDLFMDCPSRERAGWLCDSFFAARVEYILTGKSTIETNFLENYALPDSFAHLPPGMLPMCYPADHPDGIYIPNWALWIIIQLDEYMVRTSNRELIERMKSKVYDLFAYFRAYLNEDGLLEKLDSWVFIEWSHANKLVQDVNYPTNMLYARALQVAGRLYGDSELTTQGETIQDTIRRQSYNGQYFVDNAIRKDGKLHLSGETTEVCQYYAFAFDIATPETYPELWQRLLTDFGPDRKRTNKHNEVYFANSFVGNYLRLDLLSRYGYAANVMLEMEGYFSQMAQLTGTLWENDSTEASCNHGFASHAVYWLYKDALGVRQVDHNKRLIRVVLAANGLQTCAGSLPIGDGVFKLKWRREGNRWHYAVAGDHGYEVQVEAGAGVDSIKFRKEYE